MNENEKTLVIGGTGAMGRAVVEQLVRIPGRSVVVPTRDAQSTRARHLQTSGAVEIVEGELTDSAWLDGLMGTVDSVFCNTNFFAANSPVAEYELGRAILDSAHRQRVGRFIWSSLDDALALTAGTVAVPHYDGKAAVASSINLQRAEEMMRQVDDGWFTDHVAILTTAPYYENLTSALAPTPGRLTDGREGITFVLPFGDGHYPMIALSDIGWFAAYMFTNWQSWGTRDLAVVGDRLSGADIARTVERHTGIPAEYRNLPLEVVVASVPEVGHDLAAMSAFLQTRDITTRDRDLTRLRAIHPALLTFDQWAATAAWPAPARTR
ncbi:NmrA family NAD(P)-binding protein [Actinoplanes couchii]|uniref:NmrA-like domain-containing protein n=1 Tax=Actinoplanes couchii TaxID=403638 RepID=A0ABQ3XM37_9ACTN|nr:NmrA family NAD(P)-binding protein [Actinoplanes couchii]MDR6319310.1 uncharacterized protein YbjT (DUF2867 family) [Actinoplanes couchii]GID59482.1 hypothetical protein Aco03nite_078860 [Actinoplanes couchii]